MKNRRNIIVAFLLCACLIVGIGYANVAGKLAISGTAKFNGAEVLKNEITEAVKFKSAEAIKNVESARISGDDYGDITAVINDPKGEADTFEAQAVFTVIYESDDETYPEVIFQTPVASLTAVGGGAVSEYWSIEVIYRNASEGATVSTDGKTATLAPGATVEALVTVTFNNKIGESPVFTGTDSAALSIALDYTTAVVND